MSPHFDLEITPDCVRSGLGARLHNVDLSRPQTETELAELRRLSLEYPALVIPGQNLSAAQLLAFARSFGEVQIHTAEQYHHPEFPELSYVASVGRDGSVDQFGSTMRAQGWHSDGSFLPHPFSRALLYAVEAPREGGTTMFANMYHAYDALPQAWRERVDAAYAVHALASGPEGAGAPSAKKRHLFPEVTKPVVRVNPETGRRALFVNAMHTSHIVGLPRQESDIMLRDLVSFGTQPQFVYEHKWSDGDIVIWDERSTLHRAGGPVAPGQRRVLLRTLFKDTE